MKTTTRTLGLVGALAFAGIALSGCASSQSKAEACEFIVTQVVSYSESSQKDLTAAREAGDAEKMLDLQADFFDNLAAVRDGVSHPEVKESFGKLVSTSQEIISIAKKLMKGADADAQDEFVKVQERASEAKDAFNKVCPASSTGLLE